MKAFPGARTALHAGTPALLADVLQLGKPRITALVVITMALGFALASPFGIDAGRLLAAIVGTALVSWGINALNQYLERDLDARMPRTATRPLPAGRLRPDPVFYAGFGVTVAGLAVLVLGAHPLAGVIGAVVAVIYVLVYTPLKRVTQLNTVVGAIPGALPPVLGWAAAQGSLAPEALALFLIMFVWQHPHFLPIAWLYRHDYARAGMAMITVSDPSGESLRRQLLLYTATLVLVSLYPTYIGMAGAVYFAGALGLGVVFLVAAGALVLRLSEPRARWVLKVSVLYLPLLLALLVYDATAL